jgi:hypothetical protein
VTVKKDTPSRRFWDLLEEFKRHVDVKGDDTDWTNPAEMLKLALSFSVHPGNPGDDAIATAFAKSGLNVRNPLHWKLLLTLFCLAHFGEWPKRAAERLWTSARLEKLYKHVVQIESRRSQSLAPLGNTAIADILKKTKKDTYGDFTIEYLRERIRDARQSRKEFDDLLQRHLKTMRVVYEGVGVKWTSEVEAKITNSFARTARKMSIAAGAD